MGGLRFLSEGSGHFVPDYVPCKLSKFLPTHQALLPLTQNKGELPLVDSSSLLEAPCLLLSSYRPCQDLWAHKVLVMGLLCVHSEHQTGGRLSLLLHPRAVQTHYCPVHICDEECKDTRTHTHRESLGEERALCACHRNYFSLGLTHSKQSWSCLSLQPDQTICGTLGMNWK